MCIWMAGYIHGLWGLYYLLHDVPESDVGMFVQAQTGAYFLSVCVHLCNMCDGTCINRSKLSGRFENERA